MKCIKTGIEEFDRITGGLPPNDTIILEERIGSIKTIFAQQVADTISKDGGRTLYITAKSKREIDESMKIYGMNLNGVIDIDSSDSALKEAEHDLILIEDFSIRYLDRDVDDLLRLMGDLKVKRSTVMILLDAGVLDERIERAMRAVVDGVIEFRLEYQKDKLYRTIAIPKFKNVIDEIIPFTINESGIVVDTRKRV
ncbi:MAG: RAD55 family ATPase [Candidatus Syntropharchaeales archaeon]